jgi:ABC-type sugar transport system substrate-binding protein
MYELYAIAAAVIGGVSLMGGEGLVAGTLVGALVMGTLRNGLNLLNVPAAWEGVAVGAVLVVAVVVDRARHRGGARTRARTGAARAARWALVAAGALGLIGGATAFRLHRDAAAAESALTIAFVPKSIDSPFWIAMKDAAEAEGRRRGARVVTLAPERETDVEAQLRIVENLIDQRVDAILLAPAGSREMVTAVRKANLARIPVLIVDSDIDREAARRAGATTAAFIGSDNAQGGRLAGDYLARALGGRGEVAIVEGTTGHESTESRTRGFRTVVAGHPGLRVVASQPANGERDRAYTVMQNLLQAHPRVKGVFAANDEMALGAVEALDAAGRLGDVRVVGFDATPEAQASIRAGRLLASVAQYPGDMGRIGVEKAAAVVGGARLPPVLHTRVELIDRAAAARAAGQ